MTTAVAAAGLVVTSPLAASASPSSHAPRVTVLNSSVIAPFQLAMGPHHRLYSSDGGTSEVLRLWPGGSRTAVHGPNPGEVAGIAYDAQGTRAYTSTDYTTGQTSLTIKAPGKRAVVANLSQFEADHNPDAHVTYGVDHPSQCVQDAFAPMGGASYTGVVDSHPYSVASLGHGSWVVGEAAGNELLKVDARGHISVLTLLPRQPLKITAEIAAGLGMPDCVVGVTYNFEPVPTDVQVWHGKIYTSLLPGGPEGPQLGARGSVYTVSMGGHARKLAGGFLGATNLAVADDGAVYVAELFAG